MIVVLTVLALNCAETLSLLCSFTCGYSGHTKEMFRFGESSSVCSPEEVVVKLGADKFPDWEKTGFAPEVVGWVHTFP